MGTVDNSTLEPMMRARRPRYELDADRSARMVQARLFGGDEATTVGRYRLEARLSAGGMGVVHTAYDPELDRAVAIKLVHPDAVADGSQGRARLIREAQALAAVSHVNVMPIYDVGVCKIEAAFALPEEEASDRTVIEGVYLVMELVDGEELGPWLRRKRRPWREILGTLLAAARGLSAAHDAGLIHRDFKPANVLIGKDGRVRVLDFGLARSGSDSTSGMDGSAPTPSTWASGDLERPLTRRGAVIGTPTYMSPEQHRGEPVDHRSDQYSFCVAAYLALYGKLPFDAKSSTALLDQKTVRPTRRPPARTAPGWVWRALRRGLEPDPLHRFESMSALIAQLEPRPARRRLVWGATATAAVAIAGAAMAWGGSGCEDASVDATWNPAERARLRAAVLDGGQPYAADTWAHVDPRLDGYAKQWTRVRQQACDSPTHGGQLQQRALLCLDQRRRAFEAAVEVVAAADSATTARLPEVVAGLPPVRACLDAPASEDPETTDTGVADDVRDRLARVVAQQRAGRYDQALSGAGEALVVARRDGSLALEAEALHQLGTLEAETGDGIAAETSLSAAVFAAQEAGHDRIAALAAINLVYAVGERQARYDDALEWARHAETWIDRAGLDDGARARLDNYVAAMQLRKGKPRVALPRYESARAILEQRDDPVALGHVLMNSGSAYGALAQFELAQQRYEMAIDTFTAALGDHHPTVALALANKGNLLNQAGRPTEAEPVLRRALGIFDNMSDPEHSKLALALQNLGASLGRQQRYDEAKPYYDRALAIRRRIFGPDHPAVADTLSDLALLASAGSDFAAAEGLQREVLAVRIRVLGAEHPKVALGRINLGETLRALSRKGEAAAEYRAALTNLEASNGEDHPHLAYPLIGLGDLALAANEPDDALAYFERAQSLRARAAGDPLARAETDFRVAQTLRALDRDPARAAHLARQAHAAYAAVPGHPEAATVQAFVDATSSAGR